jgi:RNA polymerase sigma-70 factor (ECF subfamily)
MEDDLRTHEESGVVISEEDLGVIAALRARDEAAFGALVERYNAGLLRLATVYVKDRAVAEEVVQETWIGLLQSLPRFEGRSSLKTWIFRILVNCARTRARKESRSIPFSALSDTALDPGEPSVDPDRFHPSGHAAAGAWATPPGRWQSPEDRALATETRARIGDAIEELPAAQREVITLRDIQGLTAEEVCNVLELSDTNQRVLLLRARSRVGRALAAYRSESGI